MHRRDLLKLISLSTLALAASGLTACAADPQDPGLEPRTPEVEGLDLVAADVPRAEGDPAAIGAVVAAMHVTGGAIFGSLGAQESGNLAVSPYSISAALALTANGAKGTTLDQLELVFGGTGIRQVNGGLNALTAHVESLAGDVEKRDGTRTTLALDAANALFGQRGVTWEEPFLETLATSYGAGMNVVDWAGDTEGARNAVNTWTAEQTRDKIPEILTQDSVGADVRMVLVNTLYIKAAWEQPFDKELTEDGAFTLLDATTVDVPLMKGSEPTGDAFATGEGWQAARLPYAGAQVAMTVVVPDAGRYADVEADLVARGAGSYLAALEPDNVMVTLPSWTFRVHRSLVEPLQELGVEVPFEGGAADFSAMTTEEDLYVSGVEHEVFIAVDEEGTEAAAATAVVVRTTSAPMVSELVADRPFLFVIHDVEHGTPLFLGRVVDPRG